MNKNQMDRMKKHPAYVGLFMVSIFTMLSLLSGCAKDRSLISTKLDRTPFQSVSIKNAMLFQSGKEKSACAMCGMHLPTFYKTNHVADTKETTKQYCSLHCLVNDKELHHAELKNIRVVDTQSLNMIDASRAYYVVGSSKSGTMSPVSKYAFAKADDARDFVKAFGGKVMRFDAAYDVAKRDFSSKK